MVRVSTETTVEEFTSRRDDMKDLNTALNSLASEYNTSITSINNTIAAITFDHWEDAVSVLLKSFVENMKDHVDTISKDISGGGFVALQTTAERLAMQLDACAKEKKRLEEWKLKLDDIKANHYYIQSGNSQIVNPQIAVLERQIGLLETSLRNKVDICNALFERLAEIEFNPKTPYTIPDVDTTEVDLNSNNYVPGEPISPGNEKPVENENPKGNEDSKGDENPPTGDKKWTFGGWFVDAAVDVLKLAEGVGTAAENVVDCISLVLNFGHKQKVLDDVARDDVSSFFNKYIYGDWANKYGNAGTDGWIATGCKKIGKMAGYAGMALGVASGIGAIPASATLATAIGSTAPALIGAGFAGVGDYAESAADSVSATGKIDQGAAVVHGAFGSLEQYGAMKATPGIVKKLGEAGRGIKTGASKVWAKIRGTDAPTRVTGAPFPEEGTPGVGGGTPGVDASTHEPYSVYSTSSGETSFNPTYDESAFRYENELSTEGYKRLQDYATDEMMSRIATDPAYEGIRNQIAADPSFAEKLGLTPEMVASLGL